MQKITIKNPNDFLRRMGQLEQTLDGKDTVNFSLTEDDKPLFTLSTQKEDVVISEILDRIVFSKEDVMLDPNDAGFEVLVEDTLLGTQPKPLIFIKSLIDGGVVESFSTWIRIPFNEALLKKHWFKVLEGQADREVMLSEHEKVTIAPGVGILSYNDELVVDGKTVMGELGSEVLDIWSAISIDQIELK